MSPKDPSEYSMNDVRRLLRCERAGEMSRRDLIRFLAQAGVAAGLYGSGVAIKAQTPAAPAGVKVLNGKQVLKREDLRFDGYLRIPIVDDLWGSRPGIGAPNWVDGKLRFFSWGDFPGNYDLGVPNCPAIEYEIPSDAEPNTTLSSAPFITKIRDWGGVRFGHMRTSNDDSTNPAVEPPWGNTAGGQWWDEARNGWWWNYGVGYVPDGHIPNMGFTHITNRSTGAYTSYGPWRTEVHHMMVQGSMTDAPQAFADTYLSGNRCLAMGHQSSGNANASFGASMHALTLPDPFTTPVDSTLTTNKTIYTQGLIKHPSEHPQARDANYKICDWVVKYVCAGGVILRAGPPWWGTTPAYAYDQAMGEPDSMSCMVWVDLPDKHGILYFGALATTPTGYTAPDDADGLIHRGYGQLADPGDGRGICCHGQQDPWSTATGPWTHCRVPMGWIYNPDDMVATARGKAPLWSREPTESWQWRDYISSFRLRYSWNFGLGAYFHAATRKIYVIMARQDETSSTPPDAYTGRPVVMVFTVLPG